MKVKSTGLGKTQLTAHFDGFTAKEGGEASAVLIITSTEPVHWHIECDLGGGDLRRFAAQVLRPAMIWHLIKLLARGGEARGFVMEKEGGRRSRKERVSRSATPEARTSADPIAPATAAGPVAAATTTAPEAAALTTVAAGADGAADAATSVRTAGPAPATARRPVKGPASGDAGDRDEREQRRAERRRQREEAAQQYVTAG